MKPQSEQNVNSPGWYQYAETEQVERYWDGIEWTEQVRFSDPQKRRILFSPRKFPHLWKWYLLALVFLFLVVFNIATISASKPETDSSGTTELSISETPSEEAVSDIEIPADYQDSGNGIAFFAVPSGACQTGQFGCTEILMFATKDCPKGVEVFANLFAEGGQEVARTNAISSPVTRGQTTSVLLSTSLNTAVSAVPNQFICK